MVEVEIGVADRPRDVVLDGVLELSQRRADP